MAMGTDGDHTCWARSTLVQLHKCASLQCASTCKQLVCSYALHNTTAAHTCSTARHTPSTCVAQRCCTIVLYSRAEPSVQVVGGPGSHVECVTRLHNGPFTGLGTHSVQPVVPHHNRLPAACSPNPPDDLPWLDPPIALPHLFSSCCLSLLADRASTHMTMITHSALRSTW